MILVLRKTFYEYTAVDDGDMVSIFSVDETSQGTGLTVTFTDGTIYSFDGIPMESIYPA